MKVLELSRKYIAKEYNGNEVEAIHAMDGIIFDNTQIKNTFNAGRGTEKHFKEYMENNRPYCLYFDMEKQCFI